MMLNLFLFLHQLPQNMLGLVIIKITGAVKTVRDYEYVAYNYNYFGISLGDYIIFGHKGPDIISYKHERGHRRQSLYLGWLYLIFIGLPSLIGNIWDRVFHASWPAERRIDWYYSLPVEKWADQLGGVKRWRIL